MSEPQTVNGGLIIPNTGDLVGTWGSAALNPDFVALDGQLYGVQTVSASNAPIVLTSPSGFTPSPGPGPTQSQNAVLRFTGALTAAVPVTLPLPGYVVIENLTTGNFVLSFRAIGSGQIIAVDQGEVQHIYNDGTNVRFVNLPTVGSYLDICDATVPAWIAACTVPPYLLCNGGTFSAATYPYLNAKLGRNTLPDLRGVSRYTLNQGTGRITTAGSGLDGDTRFSIKTTQAQTLLTANLPPYTPAGLIANGSISVQTNVASVVNGANGAFSTAAIGGGRSDLSVALGLSLGTFTFTGTPAPGQTSAPFGLVATGTVAGITLIRAA